MQGQWFLLDEARENILEKRKKKVEKKRCNAHVQRPSRDPCQNQQEHMWKMHPKNTFTQTVSGKAIHGSYYHRHHLLF